MNRPRWHDVVIALAIAAVAAAGVWAFWGQELFGEPPPAASAPPDTAT